MNWCQNCFCHRFYDESQKYLSLLGQLVSEKLGFSEETAHGALMSLITCLNDSITANRMSLQKCHHCGNVTEKGDEGMRLTLSPQTGQSSSSPSFVSGCSDCPITPYSIDAPEKRHGSDMMDDMYGLDVIDVMLLMLLLLLLCCWTMVGLCMLAALFPPCIPP